MDNRNKKIDKNTNTNKTINKNTSNNIISKIQLKDNNYV